MSELKNGLILNPETPDLRQLPADTPPPADRNDITDIDENYLSAHILENFKNDIADKNESKVLDNILYEQNSYYGKKNESLKHFPWEGASAFPVPLTPTLVDTAHSNLMAGIWEGTDGPAKIKGTGIEDIRTSRALEGLLNWQIMNDMEMYQESDKNTFRTIVHGTGFLKIIFDIKTNKVKVYSIDPNNIFMPIDARGMQVGDTDHIIHIIPLSYNDLQIRKGLNVYRDIDSVQAGIGIYNGSNIDTIRTNIDQIAGTDLTNRMRRENYYIAEVDISHVPKGAYKSREFKVWISPSSGKILRIRENKRKIRPYADYHLYPYDDRFFSMSMPLKIRNIQEKLDYADKQNTDALDRNISPAMFVEDTDSFERGREQRVPGGIYPIGKNNRVYYEPQPPMERGFERMQSILWEQAERLTGIIDVTQGRSTSFAGKTLGEIEIRAARADVRFKTVFKRMEQGWNKSINLIYELDNEFMPRNKKVKVLGYSELKKIEEIFPNSQFEEIGLGLSGSYDFQFAGQLPADREQENEKIINFASTEMLNPLVQNNPANIWRLTLLKARAYGIRDIENHIAKPKEADILNVEEFIQRVMSGQLDANIEPGIDTDRYIFKLQQFMKTDSFMTLNQQQQIALVKGLQIAYVMSVQERKALMDLAIVKQGAAMSAQQTQDIPLPEVA